MVDFAACRTMMVDTQVRPNDVTKYTVLEAMLSVPRELYVPEPLRPVAYMGENIEIAPGRWLLEPRTIGKLLDALNVQPDELVLEIGAGLGYVSALLARMAEAVVALEEDPELAARAEAALSEQGIHNAAVVTGTLAEGYPGQAPYDVIVVPAGVETVPRPILDQLREGGRIGAIFVENRLGVVRIGHKLDGHVAWRHVFNAGAPTLPGFGAARQFSL